MQQSATLIEPRFPSWDVVVADLIATESPYLADPTGQQDSTAAIQKALTDCEAIGGGTVYLPAGRYRITGPLTIPSFVTLRGDWQDPDLGNEYGTILLADVPSSQENLPALVTIRGSAGVHSLTVYYPNQSIDDVKPYPFTFYIAGDMLHSITNCTILNGYKGVGANVEEGVHEMMSLDTLKGTFLCNIAEAYNQSDVGTWKNITASNTYWANAGAGLAPAALDKINAYTSRYGTGLILGDLEWTQLTNFKLDHYRIGVRIVKGKRIEFAGSFFDLDVSDCEVGLQVESIDTRWGTLLANSRIQGNKYAIINQTQGLVKMTGTVVEGPVSGDHICQEHPEKAVESPCYTRQPVRVSSHMYNVTAAPYLADRTARQDASSAIQKALDDAAVAGGAVYLPAGDYRLDNPLTVPAGVVLLGASPVPVRDQRHSSAGTKLFACCGEDTPHPETDTALVTLDGDNAGIAGLRILYPNNGPQGEDNAVTVRNYPYAVRGKGTGVYAVNLAIAGACYGVDFSGCDGHLIKKVTTLCYFTAFRLAHCRDGLVEGCLQNGTVLVRHQKDLYPSLFPDAPAMIDERHGFPRLMNPITRKKTTIFSLEDAQDETILNCFAYGVNTYLDIRNSRDIRILNTGSDNLSESGPYLRAEGGGITAVNMMRFNGYSVENSTGHPAHLALYNRLSINEKDEPDYLV